MFGFGKRKVSEEELVKAAMQRMAPPQPTPGTKKVFRVTVVHGKETSGHKADTMNVTQGNCLIVGLGGDPVAIYKAWDALKVEGPAK